MQTVKVGCSFAPSSNSILDICIPTLPSNLTLRPGRTGSLCARSYLRVDAKERGAFKVWGTYRHQVFTVFRSKDEIDRIHHTNTRLDIERTVRRITLAGCLVRGMVWDMRSMAMPEIHHFCPVLRREIFPDGDFATL